ncbi:MAG: hypothetical protein JW739_01885 [Opitutales bacterium]|nr:hypothetical protein [Opitutales bacterium]
MNRIVYTLGLFFVLGLIAVGCQSIDADQHDPLTHGNVTLHLRQGVTSQADVLELFGAPNIATVNSEGNEVWTYQRHATVTKASNSYSTIVLLGASTSGFSESSRTMTLIIKFNKEKIVSEFKSMSSNF